MKKALPISAIFLGSFIAFALEPMIGRTLLPSFGGSAAVWVTCLAAFQILMVGGYWYAEAAGRRTRAHVALLLAAAAWCIFVAFRKGAVLGWIAGALPVPALNVLLSVMVLAGASFVLLSANSTLVSSVSGGDYRLYAWSNAGSLTGLLAYPFVLEPWVSMTAQWVLAGVGILVYAASIAMLAGRTRGSASLPCGTTLTRGGASLPATVAPAVARWTGLSAAGCFLLNAMTAHLTLDVMPMPLVWTLTLAIFLVSYIIGFSGRAGRCATGVFMFVALGLGVALAALNVATIYRSVNFVVVLAVSCAFLLAACSFIHSWLYAVRPERNMMPRYYLCIAVGGAVGGVAASILFPLAATSVLEYPAALGAVALLAVAWAFGRGWLARGAAMALVVAGVVLYSVNSRRDTRPSVAKERGFFGVVEVLESKARTKAGEGVLREFIHGTTVHGLQALLPGRERMPTAYYTRNGCGYAIAGHPKHRDGRPMRVCLVGLGLGVSYAYAREGDFYRGYEISREALEIASNTNLFTFVSGCPAKHEELLEDARKGLEREAAAGEEPYDVIIVDAFSGDSQPYHLSTREAFELYFRRLRTDGVLCVNISNWHMDLVPFMKAVGDAFACPLMGFSCGDDFGALQFSTRAAFLCRDPSGLAAPPRGARMIDFTRAKSMGALPTDEKGSFIELINW